MFERLRQTLEGLLDAATRPEDARSVAGRMQEAVVEARVSLDEMRAQRAATTDRLAREREQLAAAERRGKLAEGIADGETVRVAAEFAAKHRGRAEVLARKLTAQEDELALAEQEYGAMRQQLQRVRRQAVSGGAPTDDLDSAVRDLEATLGRQAQDWREDALRAQMDAAARDQRADEQLRELKRKMGR